MNIWKKLSSSPPLLILAPMEDVTDTVFRQVIAQCGKPDLFFTEFTNCEGAQSVGQASVVKRLIHTQIDKPLIAQVWGITPDDYYKTAQLIHGLGFDGIDINMGCPVKKIIKQGACSALINNQKLAKEVFEATKAGGGTLPVSIKTRIGFDSIKTEEWIGFLLRLNNLSALTIHGRTVKEQSKVPNHWEEIGKSVELRNQIQSNSNSHTLIIGNGDITSYSQAIDIANSYSLDGVMIGRGVLSNPWIFDKDTDPTQKSILDRLNLLSFHLELWKKTWGDGSSNTKRFSILKKYYKIYIQGFEGASEIRSELMKLTNCDDTLRYITHYINTLTTSISNTLE